MATKEHELVLSKGATAWNEWLDNNRQMTLHYGGIKHHGAKLTNQDLSGIKLHETDFYNADFSNSILQDANFYRAHLLQARFDGADLRRAHLYRADLQSATLRGANLAEADLSCTNLAEADLNGANLTKANLGAANLNGAKLQDADLTDATFGWTAIGNANLRGVAGLDTINHTGPSSLDIRTILLSGNDIPALFLEMVGLPDDIIEYLGSLISNPIEYFSAFISFSSKDQDFAERLHNDLQENGVRCWFAPEDLKIGKKLRIGIDESIRLHDKLLIILSSNSVTSDWVEQEVETALEREKELDSEVLFPVRLDDAVMNIKTGWPGLIRKTRNIGDFRNWKDHKSYQEAFERLLHDLKAEGDSNG